MEEALKTSRNEVKEVKKKVLLYEEQINEYKKLQKKSIEKTNNQLEIKNKIIDDYKKSNEIQYIQIQRSNQELLNKLQDEKEAKLKLQTEYDTIQRTLKKATEQLKELSRERDRLATAAASKHREHHKEHKEPKESDHDKVERASTSEGPPPPPPTSSAAMSRAPIRPSFAPSSTASNGGKDLVNTVLGPPKRANEFIAPSAAMRPVRRLPPRQSVSGAAAPTAASTARTSTIRRASHTSITSTDNTSDPTVQMITSLTESSSTTPALDESMVDESSIPLTLQLSPNKPAAHTGIPISTRASLSSSSRPLNSARSIGDSSSEDIRSLRKPSLHNDNTLTSASITRPTSNSITTCDPPSAPVTATSSSSLLRTGIAVRSREALQRHQVSIDTLASYDKLYYNTLHYTIIHYIIL